VCLLEDIMLPLGRLNEVKERYPDTHLYTQIAFPNNMITDNQKKKIHMQL